VTDQLLTLVTSYGLPALFGVLVLAAAGIPFPATLLLIAAGSFVAQGEMDLVQVLVIGSAGAIIGDQLGYGLGRWGGRKLVHRLAKRFGGTQLERAEAFTTRWGGAGIFFSRWLVSSLGPWINLTSGITAYPWTRFVIWGVLGELLWVALCVMVGNLFSDRVQYLAEVLGNLAWVIVGSLVALILGWTLFQSFRRSSEIQAKNVGVAARNHP
jgi:membrane-associated protein